jgi:hypothetical protein
VRAQSGANSCLKVEFYSETFAVLSPNLRVHQSDPLTMDADSSDAGLAPFDWIGRKAKRAADYAHFLYVQRVKGFQVPDRPDFDDETIPLFLSRIATARRYLEFGSGASTVLAARQGVPLTTVETDPSYLAAVRRKLAAAGLLDLSKQRFMRGRIGLTEHWGAPLFRTPTPTRIARWRAYIDAPWSGDVPAPDFILVDGRFRAACALNAIRRLGGARDWELWLDDYEGREHYTIVAEFAVLERMSGVTAIFKPRESVDHEALETAIEEAVRDYR